MPDATKTLIAVFSCHKLDYKDPNGLLVDYFLPRRTYEDRLEALRSTWLQDVSRFGFDYKVFKGVGAASSNPDEVILNAPDGYYQSSRKMLALVRWALANGYERVFKVDDDSFVYLDRLEPPSTGDLVGRNGGNVAGGPGYWLSKDALKFLARCNNPYPWAEDAWVNKMIQIAGLRVEYDNRYYCAKDMYIDLDELPTNHNYVALTACPAGVMNTLYTDWKARKGSHGSL